MPRPKIHPSEIKIEDFRYVLPEEKIARYPLEKRDASKLLIYQEGEIKEDIYKNIAAHIPSQTLLLFNQAKVVHARLFFKKSTGAKLEIFCLEPDERYPDITSAMWQEKKVYWKCLVKGAHKWKENSILYLQTDANSSFNATAQKIGQSGNTFTILFEWQKRDGQATTFSDFLAYAGKIPIPPYLKREAEESDEIRYQTIFAKKEGSVAAPTASLHFTPRILEDLKSRHIDMEKLTLHVGAGTFLPVKSKKMGGHEMHSEWIEFSLTLLEKVAGQIKKGEKIICVGTTSCRALESIYWIGVQLLRGEWSPEKAEHIAVSQWYPYEREDQFGALEAIEAVIRYFQEKDMEKLVTRTKLIIAPGYDFKLTDGLITNFHQPASTLLLMIASLVGKDWKTIYSYALEHNFRFLSYGDGSLLWKENVSS